MKNSIITPAHLIVIRRVPEGWNFGNRKVFYKKDPDRKCDPQNPEKEFGLTKLDIICDIFKMNQAKIGYYIVDLLRREYHYCGLEWQNVKDTFLKLGIGRKDPLGD